MSIHITKEAMKAETTIRRIRKNAEKAKQHTAHKWLAKEFAYIGGLAPEVQRTLMVAGVIQGQDLTIPLRDDEVVEEAELLS